MDPVNGMLGEVGGCSACSGQAGGGRKLSAYNKFMKTEMKKLKAAHPTKKSSDLMKMAARKWKEVKPAATKPATRRSATKKSATRSATRQTTRKSATKTSRK